MGKRLICKFLQCLLEEGTRFGLRLPTFPLEHGLPWSAPRSCWRERPLRGQFCGDRTAELTNEIERLKGQLGHLVQFLAKGGDSPAVGVELRTIETTLEGLRAEWATIEKASALPPPRVHPAWVMTKLERLDALLRRDPQAAKVEILKRLDGDLVIVPRPSSTGERRAEISGRAKSDSLLRDQEAVCLQVVAGAGFEPATFGL